MSSREVGDVTADRLRLRLRDGPAGDDRSERLGEIAACWCGPLESQIHIPIVNPPAIHDASARVNRRFRCDRRPDELRQDLLRIPQGKK